jgi:plasmid maintenance system antidote protein VapI
VAREGVTEHFPGAGGRIEALRRQLRHEGGRRVSQSELATLADVSRATLSVAINADRLTGRTARKLARILETSEDVILYGESPTGQWEPAPDGEEVAPSPNAAALEEWVSNLDRIVLTLRNFPGGDIGQKLKIGFLNAVEDIARDTGNKLPIEYYALRKQVQDGDL